MRASSRRRFAVVATLLCCLSIAAPVAVAQNGSNESDGAGGPGVCTGVVEEPADGMTVISVQGFRFGKDGGKRPAKLVGVGPKGDVKWVHHSAEKYDAVWGYDVDPMANGNVFVTATVKGHETLVYELNPRTQERVWSKTFDVADTHDADLINNGTEILVANMRNYDAQNETNEDSIFVYNRTTEEIEWRWRFDDHYDPAETNERANYSDDWTHVNDVDKIGDGLYMASPRNFDQVIVVNRTTNEIEMKLGEDGNRDILDQQHNPDYLESENGTPTILVGDSENGRIAEYANPDGGERTDGSRASSEQSSDGDLTNGQGWNRTWTLTGELKWPRDADRLPNGNTLVSDSSHHRVVEVTPQGEVVWEFYAPWLVYDAARVTDPDESGGPTMSDLNVTGTHEVGSGAGLYQNGTKLESCHAALQNVSGVVDGDFPTRTAGETTEGAMQDDESGDGTADGEQASTTAHDDPGASIPGFGPVAALLGVVAALGVGLRQSR